jgi:hypothetical protein
MKIIFNDGTEKECIMVNGSTRYIQGANRDCLEFHFAQDAITFDELDSMFYNEENTKHIILSDGVNQYVHDNYCIRVELRYSPFLVTPATDTTPDVFEQRFMITMAQKTYAEVQMESLQDTVDTLVLENLGVI